MFVGMKFLMVTHRGVATVASRPYEQAADTRRSSPGAATILLDDLQVRRKSDIFQDKIQNLQDSESAGAGCPGSYSRLSRASPVLQHR